MKVTADRILALARSAHLAIEVGEAERYATPLSELLAELDGAARAFALDDPPTPRTVEMVGPDPASNGDAFVHRFDLGPRGAGLLDGLTVGIKDTIAISGVPRTRGRRTGWDHPGQDATIVSRILAAGGRIVGTLNLDAWCASATGESSEFGVVDNPLAPGRLAGGSSAGSGAALAAGLVDVAVGTDTAGSARIPASWCGVVALKPSHGAVPSDGVIGLDPTLDAVCPMARTVRECASLFTVLAEPRPVATTSSKRLGIVSGLESGYDAAGAAAMDEAVARFRSAGWSIASVSLPQWSSAWLIESMLLASSVPHFARTGWQGRWLEQAEEPLPWDVKPPQLVTLWILAAEALGDKSNGYYRLAHTRRQLLREEVQSAFETVDAILTPTTPTPAPKRAPRVPGSLLATTSGAATPVSTSTLTTPANLAGIPALAFPMGVSDDGLPASVQLHAPIGRDSWLFAAAEEVAD